MGMSMLYKYVPVCSLVVYIIRTDFSILSPFFCSCVCQQTCQGDSLENALDITAKVSCRSVSMYWQPQGRSALDQMTALLWKIRRCSQISLNFVVLLNRYNRSCNGRSRNTGVFHAKLVACRRRHYSKRLSKRGRATTSENGPSVLF